VSEEEVVLPSTSSDASVGPPADFAADATAAAPSGAPEPRSRRQVRRKRSRGNWPLIVVGLAVVAIAAFLVWSAIGKKAPTARYVTQAVSRGTLSIAVSANGSVVSKSSASVSPAISGTVTELDVSLGSKVKKGDVLFVVENASLDTNVTEAKASWEQAKANALKAEQAETQAELSLSTGVLQAKQSLQQAKASVDNAEVALTKAKSTVPYDQNAVDGAQHALAAAKTGRTSAQKNYDRACKIQREGLSAAQASSKAALTSRNAASLKYKQAKEDADQRTVTAPISGYITTLSITNGDQLGGGTTTSSSSRTSGSSTSGGTSTSASSGSSTPIVISDLSTLEASVQIAETDRPKVKLGQKVELTFDAVPDLTITGKVSQIDAVGSSSSGVVTFNVAIEFDLQDARLSPAMTTAASIVTRVDTDVLLVPNAAVETDSSGNSYVQVLDTPDGTPRDVTVEIGPAGDTQTEIVSGLTGNENVVTQTISANSGSSTSGSRSGMSILGGGAGRAGGGPPAGMR
jgi:multidrug efflux pump subunit AcrA (membrane-fusion protein)